jgi:hypothetical protein
MVFADKPNSRNPGLAWVLLGLAVLVFFTGCSKLGRVYLEAPEPSSGIETNAFTDAVVQIRYFFDKTASMQGFANVQNSAYIQTIPLLWETGENLWPITEPSYYVYGDLQIGRISKNLIDSRETGLLASSFYTIRNLDRLFGDRVVASDNKPFSAVNDYIHNNIDTDSRCLYVIVTDFYETNSSSVFYRFFRDAFDKNMSSALFAVESEFNGVLYDIYSDKSTPYPQSGRTGNISSTFFVLIIGSSTEVLRYSEKLYSDLTEKKITFYDTVFLISEAERASPKPASFIMAQNTRRFESDELRSSMVNMRQPQINNSQLSLYHWEEIVAVPADVEAYQILTNIGSRYSAQLTDKAIINDNSFTYPVTLQVGYHAGEKTKVEPGTISRFANHRNSDNFFVFQVVPISIETGIGRLFQRLDLVGEIRNPKNLASGYYKISYSVQAEAVVPDWVRGKNAENYEEFEASHVLGALIKVHGFRKVYNDIIDAYNAHKFRPAWSGELYLVRRK